MKPKCSFHVYQNTPLLLILRHINSFQSFSTDFSTIHFNIIYPSTLQLPKYGAQIKRKAYFATYCGLLC